LRDAANKCEREPIRANAQEANKIARDAAAADAAMSRKFGTERTVTGADLPAAGRSIKAAVKTGVPEAIHILRHGEASLALSGHNPYNAATGINNDVVMPGDSRIQPEYSSHIPGKVGDAVNAVVRAPLRAHSAFFHIMQTGAIERGLNEWANLEATKQVDPALKGKAKAEAVSKAAADMRLNPTQQGLDFAHNFAKEQLFTNDNAMSETMASARKNIGDKDKARGTNNLKKFDAATTLLVPFNKVPVNVGGKSIEYGGGLGTSAYAAGDAAFNGMKTAKAFKAGLASDNVSPEQQRIWANTIGRGALGAGAMLLGSLIHREHTLWSAPKPTGARSRTPPIWRSAAPAPSSTRSPTIHMCDCLARSAPSSTGHPASRSKDTVRVLRERRRRRRNLRGASSPRYPPKPPRSSIRNTWFATRAMPIHRSLSTFSMRSETAFQALARHYRHTHSLSRLGCGQCCHLRQQNRALDPEGYNPLRTDTT